MNSKDKDFLGSFSHFELEKIKNEECGGNLCHYIKLLELFKKFYFDERKTKLLLILFLRYFSKLPDNDQIEIIEFMNNSFYEQNPLGSTSVGGDVSNISKIEYDFEGNSLDFYNGR